MRALNSLIIGTVAVLICSGIILPEVVGFIRADYSSVTNYLSELGANGVPYGATVTNLGFLPVAITIVFMVAILLLRTPRNFRLRFGLVCIIGVALGYWGAYMYPCDVGCPAEGSDQQAMHNLFGLFQYAGAIVGMHLIYSGLKSTGLQHLSQMTIMAVTAVWLGFMLMLVPDLQHLRGLAQRLADYTIFVWISYLLVCSSDRDSD